MSRCKCWLVIMTHKSGFADTTIVLVVLDQSLEQKLQLQQGPCDMGF